MDFTFRLAKKRRKQHRIVPESWKIEEKINRCRDQLVIQPRGEGGEGGVVAQAHVDWIYLEPSSRDGNKDSKPKKLQSRPSLNLNLSFGLGSSPSPRRTLHSNILWHKTFFLFGFFFCCECSCFCFFWGSLWVSLHICFGFCLWQIFAHFSTWACSNAMRLYSIL